MNDSGKGRRRFLRRALLAAGGAAVTRWLPSSPGPIGISPAMARPPGPQIPFGVASGDVSGDRAMIWSRSDRPARMIVEYATSDSFHNARRVTGPAALEATDFTARVDLQALPAGQDIFYRVRFQDLADPRVYSETAEGHFRSAPAAGRDIRFQWSGDTAGQGWGIDEGRGGMRIYDTMRRGSPDFFIHCGDMVYADVPLESERPLPDGSVWRNVVTEAKSKVAESLAEFRGNHAYNFLDANLRAFNSEVPLVVQWDDHDTTDNWYPREFLLDDDRYTVKNASLLAARARRAFHEYNPIRSQPADAGRIFRRIEYGPALEVFVVDMRSYRGPNGANDQAASGPDTAFLGSSQVEWLKRALAASTATWKVIAADMPLGLIVYDDWRTRSSFENVANGDGPPRGRELEMAGLLSFIKRQGIENVVWLTADVHYTAAHYYDPGQARFQDFAPFWEFVSGPLNAGTFGPNEIDDTFGPQVVFQKTPPEGEFDLSPAAGLQFFGEVTIAGRDETMTVALKDVTGATLYSVDLAPAERA